MAVLFYCDLVSISARGTVIYTSINSNDDSVCVSCHSVIESYKMKSDFEDL